MTSTFQRSSISADYCCNCGRHIDEHIPEEGSRYCPLPRHMEEPVSRHHVDEALGGAHDDDWDSEVKRHERRSAVYAAYDSERDYQDALGKDRTDGRRHTVGDFILMAEDYLARARKAWTDSAGDLEALKGLRKVGGIVTRALEENGAPQREGYERKPLDNAITEAFDDEIPF